MKHASLFTVFSALLIFSFGLTQVSAFPPDIQEKRFTVQFRPSRISWNPHYAYTTTEAQIFTALYEGLVVFNPSTLRPVPGAAESWEISEDGKTITFKIRKDARWSNGDRVSSFDFLKSWQTLLNPETGAEYASLLDDIAGAREYRTGKGSVEDLGVETPDASTLTVHLIQPSPQFLSILCHYSFAPVYKDFLHAADWSGIRSVPVNGPYIIRSRSSEEILLDINPYYYDKDNVAIKGLRLIFMDDPAEVMNLFNRFEIDWVISGMDISLLSIPENVTVAPLFSTSYFYFSNTGKVWSDSRIRRALSTLLPWEEILKLFHSPATSLVPPIPNYPEASANFPGPEKRWEEALKLLEKAGYPLGAGLPGLTISVPSEDQVALIMQQTWKELLGMDVSIQIVPFPVYYESVQEGGYDIATLTWTGDYADPYTFLGMWESQSSFNESGFSNPRFDAILKESASLPFLPRFAKLKEAEDILLQSCQVLPVEHFPAVNLIDRRFVDGWFPNALDIHPFKDLVPRLGYNIPGVAEEDQKLDMRLTLTKARSRTP